MGTIALGCPWLIQIRNFNGCHRPRISVADPDTSKEFQSPMGSIALGFLWLIQIMNCVSLLQMYLVLQTRDHGSMALQPIQHPI